MQKDKNIFVKEFRARPLAYAVQVVGIIVILLNVWAFDKLLSLVKDFVKFGVFGIRKHLKVLNLVVGSISVFMVDVFVFFKKATYLFFYHKSVFVYIVMDRMRVLGHIYRNISSIIHSFSTLPFWVSTSLRKLYRSYPFRFTASGTKTKSVFLPLGYFSEETGLSFKGFFAPLALKNKIFNLRMKLSNWFDEFTNYFSHKAILAKGISYVNFR